ncbi:hypothetical protein [Cohnella sp. GCM10012308]|uniref:hypothetical protein n=1 Tax=Cohnella sp. GCM10012308 TaxID=3317329 RepID=UPI00361EB9D0
MSLKAGMRGWPAYGLKRSAVGLSREDALPRTIAEDGAVSRNKEDFVESGKNEDRALLRRMKKNRKFGERVATHSANAAF